MKSFSYSYKRPQVVAAFAWALLTVPAWCWAQPAVRSEALTMEAALQAAEARALLPESRRLQAAAAHDQAVAARQLPEPVLRLAIDNVTVEGSQRWSWRDEPMTMASAGVMQTFTREEKRTADSERWEREAYRARASEWEALSMMRTSTALAWLERHFRVREIELLRQQRGASATLVEVVEAAYRAGRAQQADSVAARIELARLDDDINRAGIALAVAETGLTRWTGIDASIPLGSSPSFASTKLVATDLQQQLLREPTLLSLTAQIAVTEAEVEIAKQEKREDWTVDLMFSQRGPGFGNMVSLGFSRPIQLWQTDKQDRQLAASLGQAESVRHQRTEVLRDQLAVVQAWLHSWRGDLQRLAFYDSTLIPFARERTATAMLAYGNGSAPLASVFEARRAEAAVEIERLLLEQEAAVSWARLEYLIPAEIEALGADENQAQTERK